MIEKEYKVSYKTYLNERLKPVNFHGKEMHPLYIQLTFDRKTIYFKSYFFDLFTKPKYANHHHDNFRMPDIKDIVAKEEALIDYIVEKNGDRFSLDIFKEHYSYYGFDILDKVDEGFKVYIFSFFIDKKLDFFGAMVNMTGLYETGIKIVEGIKGALKADLFSKLLKDAAKYPTAYLPLHAFASKKGDEMLATFCIYEWLQPDTKREVFDFLKKYFPAYDKAEVKKEVDLIISGWVLDRSQK